MKKIKSNTIHHAYLFISVLYVFFAHLSIFSDKVNINIVYLGVSAVYLGYCMVSSFQKLAVNKTDVLIILFIIYVFISSIMLSYNYEGIKYMLFLTIVYIIGINLKYTVDWSTKFVNAVRVCALIHCIFVILHALFTDIVLTIDKAILTDEIFEIVLYATKNSYYSGISIGPASAGLFATILIGIEVSNILVTAKKEKKSVINIIIAVLALVFSKKRAFIVATILSILVIVLIVEKVKNNNKKIVKKVLAFMFILVFSIVLLSSIPQTRLVMDRFLNNDRILSGREIMYNEMLKWFNENKWFGVGLGQAETTFGYGGHNIYLQMLAECGIVGSVIYFLYLMSKYIENFNISRKRKDIDSRTLFSVFMGTVLIVYGLTGNPIYDYSYLVFFTYVLAIPVSVKKECEVNEKS